MLTLPTATLGLRRENRLSLSDTKDTKDIKDTRMIYSQI